MVAGDVCLQSDCFHRGGANLPSNSSQRLVLCSVQSVQLGRRTIGLPTPRGVVQDTFPVGYESFPEMLSFPADVGGPKNCQRSAPVVHCLGNIVHMLLKGKGPVQSDSQKRILMYLPIEFAYCTLPCLFLRMPAIQRRNFLGTFFSIIVSSSSCLQILS